MKVYLVLRGGYEGGDVQSIHASLDGANAEAKDWADALNDEINMYAKEYPEHFGNERRKYALVGHWDGCVMYRQADGGNFVMVTAHDVKP